MKFTGFCLGGPLKGRKLAAAVPIVLVPLRQEKTRNTLIKFSKARYELVAGIWFYRGAE